MEDVNNTTNKENTNEVENQEVVELTEKDIVREIDRIKKKDYTDDPEKDFAERKAALAALGFGKNRLKNDSFENKNINTQNFPDLTDETYVRLTSKDLLEEMLEGNYIDLELLQDLVKLQNGIENSSLELSDTMKDIIDKGEFDKESEIKRDYNIKKLKANIDAGRINEEQEWIDLLKENSDYENINPSPEELMKFNQQIPTEEPSEAEITEKNELSMNAKIPTVNKNHYDYWSEIYRKELEKMGLVEMKIHSDGAELKRTKFENKFLDKASQIYAKNKSRLIKPFESTSIVQLDEEYGVPMQELFRESRSHNGIKFKTLPESDEQHTFKLAALKVRESGIVSPYVYASKPRNDHDLINKNKFIENQIRALLEYADYDIEEISVPHRFKPVLEKIKNEEAIKNMHVMDMNNVLQKVIDGNTTEMERRAFIEFIDIKEDNNGEEISINFNMEDKNDKKLIDTILAGKPLIEDNKNPLGRENQISLLNEKFQNAQNYTTGENPLTNEQINEEDGEEFKNEENPEHSEKVENEQNSDIDLATNTLTAKESEMIQNNKILYKFDNYENDKSNPESDINEQLDAIIGLKNKMDNLEIKKQLTDSQAELIERKATIAETFRNNPELDKTQKTVIKKILHQGVVDANYNNLRPEEQIELNDAIEKYNLQDFKDTMNRLRGVEEPKIQQNQEAIQDDLPDMSSFEVPLVDNNFDNTHYQENGYQQGYQESELQQDYQQGYQESELPQDYQRDIEYSQQAEPYQPDNELVMDKEDFDRMHANEDVGIPDFDHEGENQAMQDNKNINDLEKNKTEPENTESQVEQEMEMPAGVEVKEDKKEVIETPSDEVAEKILNRKNQKKQRIKVKPA